PDLQVVALADSLGHVDPPYLLVKFARDPLIMLAIRVPTNPDGPHAGLPRPPRPDRLQPRRALPGTAAGAAGWRRPRTGRRAGRARGRVRVRRAVVQSPAAGSRNRRRGRRADRPPATWGAAAHGDRRRRVEPPERRR